MMKRIVTVKSMRQIVMEVQQVEGVPWDNGEVEGVFHPEICASEQPHPH